MDETQGEISQQKCAQTDHREEFQTETEGTGKKQETPETWRQSREKEVADGMKCCRGKMKTKGDTGFGDDRITRDLYKSSCSETV